MATAALFCGMHFAPALLGPPLVSRLEPLPVRLTLPAPLRGRGGRVRGAGADRRRASRSIAVLALATLDGSIASAARALTRAAATAVLAPAGQLREGNALLNIAFTVGAAGGPAIAGLVVAGAGVETALLADAASFLAVAVLLAVARTARAARARGARGAVDASACGAGSPTCASARRCAACSAPRRSPSSSSRW